MCPWEEEPGSGANGRRNKGSVRLGVIGNSDRADAETNVSAAFLQRNLCLMVSPRVKKEILPSSGRIVSASSTVTFASSF